MSEKQRTVLGRLGTILIVLAAMAAFGAFAVGLATCILQ